MCLDVTWPALKLPYFNIFGRKPLRWKAAWLLISFQALWHPQSVRLALLRCSHSSVRETYGRMHPPRWTSCWCYLLFSCPPARHHDRDQLFRIRRRASTCPWSDHICYFLGMAVLNQLVVVFCLHLFLHRLVAGFWPFDFVLCDRPIYLTRDRSFICSISYSSLYLIGWAMQRLNTSPKRLGRMILNFVRVSCGWDSSLDGCNRKWVIH